MTAPCATCGEGFEARGPWMRLCWPCWRAEREKEARRDDYMRGYWDGQRDAHDGAKQTRQAPPLTADVLRDAVVLCHPDRHPPERFEQANRVTAALLALKQDRRATA